MDHPIDAVERSAQQRRTLYGSEQQLHFAARKVVRFPARDDPDGETGLHAGADHFRPDESSAAEDEYAIGPVVLCSVIHHRICQRGFPCREFG